MKNKDIRILLVDDEIDTLKLIKTIIKWGDLGCEEPIAVQGGMEALEILEYNEIDVVITDIEMPYMNGVELSKIITSQFPRIKIVFLTAHDDFYYAQHGVNMGISKYILKPINVEEINNAMVNIVKEIRNKEQKENLFEEYRSEFENNKEFFRDELLSKFVRGKITSDIFIKKGKTYNLKINPDSKYKVLNIVPEILDLIDEQRYSILKGIINRIDEKIKDKRDVFVFGMNFKRIIILSESSIINVREIEEIRKLLNMETEVAITVGVGGDYEIEQIYLSYHESNEALNYEKIYGSNSTYEYHRLGNIDKEPQISKKSKDDLQVISKSIKVGDKENLISAIKRYIQVELKDIVICQSDAIEILSVVVRTCSDLGIYINSIPELNNCYSEILKQKNIKDIIITLENQALCVMEEIKNIRSRKNVSLINNIKDYLKENMANPELNMGSVSDIFFINQSFLSRVFKQETGSTLIEYLTQLRIEETIKLATSTDFRMYEICNMVGIPDPNYFSKCFKKVTGISFAQFKTPND